MANNYTQATVSPDLPASLFSESELDALAACGLSHESDGESIYFFADEFFREEDDGEDGEPVNCIMLLKSKLKLIDPADTPYIVIEGAATCGKMRQGEFGGFAYFITREEVRFISTWGWVDEQSRKEAQQWAAAK